MENQNTTDVRQNIASRTVKTGRKENRLYGGRCPAIFLKKILENVNKL